MPETKTTIYVFIRAVPFRENEVFKALGAFPNVIEKYLCFGPHDIIAKVEAEDNAKAREVIKYGIKEIKNKKGERLVSEIDTATIFNNSSGA